MTDKQIKDDLNYIMPFGKYKGTKLERINPRYMIWLAKQDWLKEPLKSKIINVRNLYDDYWESSFSPHIVNDFAYEMCGCGLNGD